jgi:hypothetical protein
MPSIGILNELEKQLPDAIKQTFELVQIARRLNQIMNTSFYSPEVLKAMPCEDVTNLIFAASLVNMNG